uniref:FERM and PDZ domain containing 2 n=1 Tax=Amphilophus citrinellus TaxID=61819 RepID=A0A3Q0T492_AMPCI
MGTFVTLAEVLEARGSPLDEDEVWCLLLVTTDALLEISKKNMCSVLSPGSVLLSANGNLAFKSCARHEDVASFTAPEVQQGHAASSRTVAEKMVVYSLGMTLYWCVDYHLPHNQPVQISAELEGLLLSMCEDVMLRRTDLLTVLETCELHHKASMLPPAERLIRQLVEDVYRNSDMGPEFIRVLDEPLVVLELPGSIVSKKGKSLTTQRELSVVMPNGQSILVKCELKSRGGDVFDMIVAHFNLVEHFYFGLAYTDNEFFFVDTDTKISKVAPDSWKKVPSATFDLFFRVKFFINDISLLHRQTRHQYYLQLRRDLLEDRLSCHEETALYLGGLALQTEYGDCMPEVYGRSYYRPDQYVSKSVMEKCALPYIQGELLRLHSNNAQMLTDESELEFLKQQLPEYGVLFHRVTREKKPSDGEIILGVCAKGVVVYEVKDGSRSTAQTFYWRDTTTISSYKHKFAVECRGSKKKHTFITERSKIAKYLCDLCSEQHKFNNEMNSRQLSHSLVSENIVQYAAVCRAQSTQLKSFSCSETPQDDSGLTTPQNESMTKLYDDVTARIEARIKREVICVSLKKDPKLGLIVGEDTVGRYDLGIFVASIVPGGPADKDGRIRAGRLISLNHISLEGVTFSEAAEVMQNSPEEVQLIISQPKSQTTLMTDGRSRDDSLDEIVSIMMTPKASKKLHFPPEVQLLSTQDNCSLSPSANCVRPEEITVELRKISGNLGISVSGGINTNLPNGGIYIKSLVPGGAAERDGRLHTDRLLEVDGTNFQGFTYQQAVECLSKTG